MLERRITRGGLYFYGQFGCERCAIRRERSSFPGLLRPVGLIALVCNSNGRDYCKGGLALEMRAENSVVVLELEELILLRHVGNFVDVLKDTGENFVVLLKNLARNLNLIGSLQARDPRVDGVDVEGIY